MNYESLFLRGMKLDENFIKAFAFANKHKKGKLYVIGGAVYKTIITQLHGISIQVKDYDFLADSFSEIHEKDLPYLWKLGQTSFGSPHIYCGNALKVDLISLEKYDPLYKREHPATADDFLSEVPLTIQSIAFDVKASKLIGKIGIDSIEKELVLVNNGEALNKYVAKKNFTAQDYIERKAKSIGFDYIL